MSATVTAPTFDRPRVRAPRLTLIRGGAADCPAATREIRVLLAHRQRLGSHRQTVRPSGPRGQRNS